MTITNFTNPLALQESLSTRVFPRSPAEEEERGDMADRVVLAVKVAGGVWVRAAVAVQPNWSVRY